MIRVAMRGLLVRVGADQSEAGGDWNGVVDSRTGEFAYVPIPEAQPVNPCFATSYEGFEDAVTRFGATLPAHLACRNAHLDPDFEQLTYGDRRKRASQIQQNVGEGDLLAFYASLRDVHSRKLVYALVGLFHIAKISLARDLPPDQWHCNAHTRREPIGETDIVVFAAPGVSGRVERCLPIGEYRDHAYRVRAEVLDAWGGLGAKNGFIQRSARLPEITNATRFLDWFKSQNVTLIARNN